MARTDDAINAALNELMSISGAIAAAIVDLNSGMVLGKAGGADMDLEIAAAGNSDVVKSKMRVMRDLNIKGEIEDILITLQDQYHLIRPLGSDSTLFIYLVLNKAIANLALARRQLSKSEHALKL